MWRATWRSLPHRLGHLLLTALAVALGVGCLVALLGLNSMLRSTADGIVAGTTSDVTVVPAGSLTAGDAVATSALIPADVIAAIGKLPGVTAVHGQIRGGDVFPVDKDGQVLEGKLVPTIAGNYIPAAQTDDRPRIGIALGRAPKAAGEVAIDAETLTRTGLDVGQPITFARPGSSAPSRATIVGVLTLGSGRTAGATYAIFSDDGARALFLGGLAGWNGAWIEAAPKTDLPTLAAEVKELLPPGYEAIDGHRAATATQYQLHPLLGMLQLGLAVTGIIALLIAFALVRIGVAHLIAQRRPELARWRRLGAGRRMTSFVVTVELFVVGLLGSLLAVPVGLWLAGLVETLASNRGYTLGSGEPKLRAIETLLVVAGGTLLTLVASRSHIRAAVTAPPVPNRRTYASPVVRFGDSAWTGLGLVVVGVALLILVDRMPTLPRPPIWAIGGAIAIIAGAVMAVPVLGWPLVRLLGLAARLPLADAGRLAIRSITRNPARFTRTTAALVLGAGLVAAFGVLADSGRTSAAELVPQGMRGDLLVTSSGSGGFGRDVAVELAQVPGVTAVRSIGFRTALDDGSARRAVTADPADFQGVIGITVDEGRAPRAVDEVMLDAAFARSHDLGPGATWALRINQSDARVRVVGTYTTPPGTDGGDFATLRDTFVSRGVPDIDSIVSLTVSGKAASVQPAVRKVVADNPLLAVQTPQELGAAMGDRLAAVTTALDSVLQIVAVASIVGITAMLVGAATQRRRELRTLRAAGMEDWQLAAMVALEAVVMGTVGAVVGTAAGALAGWGLTLGLRESGYAVTEFEWGRLWGLVFLGLLVGLASAIVPTAWALWTSSDHRPRLPGVGWAPSQGSADRGAESAVSADPPT